MSDSRPMPGDEDLDDAMLLCDAMWRVLCDEVQTLELGPEICGIAVGLLGARLLASLDGDLTEKEVQHGADHISDVIRGTYKGLRAVALETETDKRDWN